MIHVFAGNFIGIGRGTVIVVAVGLGCGTVLHIQEKLHYGAVPGGA